ncbi:MAG TPA: endonuclease/exonuclease/phosphatase family protein [Pyrinomonadaceae bacterium]|jgi:endonuclease/exonuclease/phosphatase family metal-dependent hydrolase|nr:endonuclease/exonuclease/phosphatase family protein [Pyrinomonadaceae bacterium]
MWAKLSLCALALLMIGGALHYRPSRERSLLGTKTREGPRLRLLTWNIGYGDLEDDSRAHTKDLKAVAEAILASDADAVALQELTGQEQLDILLGHLKRRYRGAICPALKADRVEAVLVKDHPARFSQVQAGDKCVLGASFRTGGNGPEILLLSAHADAFNAARRRVFTGELIDWARQQQQQSALVFVAGDFNFELRAGNQSNFFTDNLKNDSEAYSYALKYFRDLGRNAGETALNERRIDYVFGPSEGAPLRRAEVLRDAAVGRMDHWPLVVEVALP